MNKQEYERWQREYVERAEVPAGFVDRIMDCIAEETVERGGRPLKPADPRGWSMLLRISLVSAASLVACLRIVQVLWVFSG